MPAFARPSQNLAAVAAGASLDGSRVSQLSDLLWPTVLGEPRLFLHRLRRSNGIIAIAFQWGQLIVFLATASLDITLRLGIVLAVLGGLELIRFATLARWEVWPGVMNCVFFIAYLVQLIAVAASSAAHDFLANWCGALTQLSVGVILALLCLPPVSRPFVRDNIVEGMWQSGMDLPKSELWARTAPGTQPFKGALMITGLWVVVFLIMGGSAAVVAGVYPGNEPEPTWFTVVFNYVLPYGALVVGLLLTRYARSVFASRRAQAAEAAAVEAGKDYGYEDAAPAPAYPQTAYLPPPVNAAPVQYAPPPIEAGPTVQYAAPPITK
ncbi:hypothetical protein DFJ74DRAFT_693587 [Hyaloraphidium curvatum]|nr:hypothetical protein DFJ74DRAFT_693587 [Hyaloraphidium curvatum]